jgi:hypothetical protein
MPVCPTDGSPPSFVLFNANERSVALSFFPLFFVFLFFLFFLLLGL